MRSVFPNAFALLLKDSADLRVMGKVRVAKGPLAINLPVDYTTRVGLRN
jgi:hypothetical protein